MQLIKHKFFLPILICFIFFAAYSTIGVVRQMHFLSGYDLAIVDQATWNYSHFRLAITTNQTYAFTPLLWDHVEIIFILLSPLYWIFNSVYTLIILQALAITSSGFAVWLLAQKYKIPKFTSIVLLISYLSFYGIQNAIWGDVHSLVFGVAFLAWYLYFAEMKKWKYTWVFFLLTIFSKEDMAFLTFLVTGVLFVKTRDKQLLWLMGGSIFYEFFIFYIYYPHIVIGDYRYQQGGLLSHINPTTFYDTPDKRDVFLYSSLWYGFLPFLSPLYLLPAVADLFKYFVVAQHVVTSAQSMFGHYRSSLAILLIWPTIFSISRFSFLQTKYIAIYLLVCAIVVQYALHLPLSYFSKKWFWTAPVSVSSMQHGIAAIPNNALVVTQINFLPHLSHRQYEFVLWPEKKNFNISNSPCDKTICNWFRWVGDPDYLLVDTSPDWDVRFWLTNRDDFIDGLKNLEKSGYIKPYKSWGTTALYRVIMKKNI